VLHTDDESHEGDDDEDDEDSEDFDDDRSGDDSDDRRRRASKGCGDGDSVISAAVMATAYMADPATEVFGTANDQTEEFSDENKSIVWFLMKQVRPGMDLSKVVLPTFILEPRSFLEKLTDYHYHNDLLSMAVKEESPYERMKTIVKWFLSGFYKKPKGLKKPYNPIIGETFRCYWENPNGSKTFYIAEQVSHHPPISAFYVANRRDGYIISSSILAKSKFYGNSTSAILDGTATLSFLPRGEDYTLTMPYAHCKGILMGTLTMELGGKVKIECAKTGYSTELEFKLRPFLGGGEFTNAVSGKIRLGKEVLATVDGHWDDEVRIKEKGESSSDILWKVTDEVRQSRLKRFIVPMDEQGDFESVKLWRKVSTAIENDDQNAATEEKTFLEEMQRASARERKALGKEWIPKHFALNTATQQYEYLHSDLRPWDPLNDLYQYEQDFIVKTKTKHRTPMIRTQSILSVSEQQSQHHPSSAVVDGPAGDRMRKDSSRRRKSLKTKSSSSAVSGASPGVRPKDDHESGSTIPEESDSGRPANSRRERRSPSAVSSEDAVLRRLQEALRPLEEQQRQACDCLSRVHHSLEMLMYQQRERDSNSNINRDMVLLVVLVVMIQALLNWYLTHKSQQQGFGSSS